MAPHSQLQAEPPLHITARKISNLKPINNIYSSRKNIQSASTLIELIIVIAIIAILATVGIIIYSGQQRNARDTKRKVDINTLSSGLEARFNTTCGTGKYCAMQPSQFSNGIPKDPSTGNDYTGLPADGDSTYTICANLEAGGTFCQSSQQQ